ncbi:SET domain-containing protein [Melanomma pulvis-pyrius CBS 109.77]|uniref:SET domain-containing protein n=1 Tax=Melanomma pulvis-pyrius CBS 109.77 TaxID=1314802 RepID=A0A6A6XXE5_9PLEO|nr:SET domain-containing protein [Melanomma pulvis-pyrius CBS 109.77]
MQMGRAESGSEIPLQRCADLVIISDTPKGRGVFATSVIPARTVIDVCPVLVLGLEENAKYIEKTQLYHYTYNWPIVDQHGKKKVTQAIILGLGSMFNHSTQEQNVGWERDLKGLVVTYRALRDIPAGEELCISYGARLTFKDADSVVALSEEDEIKQLIQIELD